MKTILKCAVALALIGTQCMPMSAQNVVDSTLIDMSLLPIARPRTGAERAPARGVVVPTVIQYKTTEALKFVADEDCAPITYTIYNEDSVAVLSGTLLFDENGECTVSIRSLAAGNYRLQLEIRNRLYVGLFCKEEE